MENNENINIKRILEITFSKKIICIITLILLISVVLGYAYSYYYKTPQYESSVKILLVGDENKDEKEVTQTDLNINSSLISTYSSIAKGTNVIGKTIENLRLDMSVEELQKNIEAKQIDKTQFLKITVKSDNPQTAKNIVEELSKVFSEQIKEIYKLENINIVDKAEVENEPCNINHTKDMAIFILGGMFISAVIIMMIYIFDDTIKDEKDIEQNIKLKTIGTLPISKSKSELITETDPKAHIVECLKTIRTNILYSTKKKTILITSSKEKEGKSWITNNIAVTFAQTGKSVILVDTNLRKESDKNKIFGTEHTEGLSDFIKEITDDKLKNLRKSKKYIQETKIPNLHILTSGTIPPNPAELISSNNMKNLLELLKSMYDVILLDGTSCILVADSIALSSMVDSTILIAESKKTKIKDLSKIKKLIEDVNGKVLGVILNKVKVKSNKYYGKRYGYYYGKEDIEIIENIQEKHKIVSLKDIIKKAKQNIEIEMLNEEDGIKDLQESTDLKKSDTIENNTLEINEKVSFEINNIKNEIVKLKNTFIQMKKDNRKNQLDKKSQIDKLYQDIDNLKEIQVKDSTELLEKIEKLDYGEKIQEINKMITENDYKDDFSVMMNHLIDEMKKMVNQIENLRQLQMNNSLRLLDRIEQNNYEEQFASLNKKIDDIYEKVHLSKLSESAKVAETEVAQNVASVDNVISFESLKQSKMRNAKRVFKIDEDINFEDLQALSNCVVDLRVDGALVEAVSN